MKKAICMFLCAVFVLSLGITCSCEENKSMTRIEAVKLITAMTGFDENAPGKEYECPFTDVDEKDRAYIGYAYKKGWIKGVGDNLYMPDDNITRECFLAIVLRSLGYIDSVSFEWYNPYDRANAAGIYPKVYEGEFAQDEAEDILKRRNCAYSLYSDKALKISDEFKAENWDAYTDKLSHESSQTGRIEYFYDLPQCAVIIGYITGTPHGSVPRGSVIFKEDGAWLGLHFPSISPWKSAMPEEVYLSEDKTKLYYVCNVENDYMGMYGNAVAQPAGVFEYTVDLVTREITVREIEKN